MNFPFGRFLLLCWLVNCFNLLYSFSVCSLDQSGSYLDQSGSHLEFPFPPPKGYRTLAEEMVYAVMFLSDVLVCLDYNKTK